MAIQNDFTIYPKSKVIRHTSGTTVYSSVAFYSWLMDTFDEPGFLSYETPIRFNTPTSFTMINGWFLDNGDGSDILQYLTGGGIDTSGYATVADPVYMIDLDTEVAEFVASDLDKDILDDAVAVGPLLAYKNNYPTATEARIWVRDTRVSPAAVADGSAVTVSSGTGSYTSNGASSSGDEIYLNLFSIAAFPGTPNPQVYIYQQHPADPTQRIRIAEWSAFTNWDRGSIDILFPIQLGGTLIDSGNFTSFVRQTADTFTFVESTITSAGRTPIALETSADEVNIVEGEHYLFYDGATSPTITAGDVITDNDIDLGVPPNWYAEVVSHTAWNANTGYIEIRGLRGAPADGDNIFIAGTDTTANVNGTVGDTWVSYDTETTGPVVGDLDKPVAGSLSGAERILRAFQDDGTSGKLLLQAYHTQGAIDGRTYTGTTRDFLYRDFSDNDVITAATGGSALLNVTLDANNLANTLISGFSDVTVAHVNGTVTISTVVGTFIPGERITWNGGASEAIYIDDTGTVMTLANVDPTDEPDAADAFIGDLSGATANCDSGLTDANIEGFAFPLQAENNYAVFIEGGSIYQTGRSLTDIYAYLQFYLRDGQGSTERVIYSSDGTAITLTAAEEYIKADPAYSATKSAPYGTLAGGVFFGAQGVWIEGMQAADANNIKLVDDTGALQEPFTSVTISITNTRVDDRIVIFLDDGTGLPDKDQYTSHATNNIQSGSTFDVVAAFGAFPNDTPTSGAFYVVDTSANEEHRYRYDSFNAAGGGGSDGQLVLPTERTGTATGSTALQNLHDSGATYQSWGIEVGDIIRRTTDNAWAYVTEVVSETEVNTTLLSDGSAWAVSDTYEMNSLITTYDATDTFFIPYMERIEDTGTDGTPGSEEDTLTYVTDRNVLITVRNVENVNPIIPFTTTGTITNTGLTQSVIRNADTVYT